MSMPAYGHQKETAMKIKTAIILGCAAFALPLAAFAQSSDVDYCKKLGGLARTSTRILSDNEQNIIAVTELTEAAKAHSRDLAKWDRISHYGSDGSNPWDRVKRAGYNAKLAAENVGTGQTTIEEVMKGWQASAGHNKNLLLGDAQEMGIALVQDPRTEFKTFWTLVVGSSL